MRFAFTMRSVKPRAFIEETAPALRQLPNRFASVSGKADWEPLFPDNPFVAPNRRATLALLKESPPTPLGRNLP